MMKKMKIKKKATWIIGLSTILLLLLSFLCLLWLNKEDELQFYVNEKIKTELALTVEYGEALHLTPEELHLSAKKGSTDCTIQYQIPEITELKTYEIPYIVEGETKSFIVKLKVEDTTAPELSGEVSYQITEGDLFDVNSLKLSVHDNYDKEITLEMENVDTSVVGTQELQVIAMDSNGNQATITIELLIEEKVIPQSQANDSTTNQEQPNVSQGGSNSTNDQHTGRRVVANPNDIHVLLNKQNALPDGWTPSDLTDVGGYLLRSEAASQWLAAKQAAQAEGIQINLISAYRSQSYQTNLYNQYMASDPENAPYYSAYPRTSEHESGLAIDVSYDYALHEDLQNSSVGQWMNNNGWKYGWILRYPSNKTQVTGYMFEPWHYRYVGVDLATTLHQSSLTMEEYFHQ